MEMYRAKINQPSTLQRYNKLHGVVGIVQDDGRDPVRIYFTEGAIHSMNIARICFDRIKLSNAED